MKSPYQIFWTILIPVSGKATKSDLKAFKKECVTASIFENCIIFFGCNGWSVPQKLSKNYKLIRITDKQFGMIDLHKGQSPLSVATNMQINNTVLISTL